MTFTVNIDWQHSLASKLQLGCYQDCCSVLTELVRPCDIQEASLPVQAAPLSPLVPGPSVGGEPLPQPQ